MAKRNIKSAVKSKNKSQSKANRQKISHRKQKKGANKATNKEEEVLRDRVFTTTTNVVHKRHAIYDDDDDLDELRENMQRRKIRKSSEHDDMVDVEMNYQLKSLSLKKKKKTGDERRMVELALPIKTREGKLMRNARAIDHEKDVTMKEDDEKTTNDSNQNGQVVPQDDEKPKTALDLIRERKLVLEKTKEKIAHLSRQVIENPQQQVEFKNFFNPQI